MPSGSLLALVTAVEVAVEGLASAEIPRPDDAATLDDALQRVRRPLAQLEGFRSRVMAAVHAARVAEGGTSVQEVRQELAVEQRLSPGDTKRAIDAGRAARDNERTDRAIRAGDLGSAHAQLIARILAEVDDDVRASVEAELLPLARAHDPVAFGRLARGVLARYRPDALARDERRLQQDRRFRGTDTVEGGFAFSGLLYGVDAEQAREALRAFRRPDGPDERRRPEQRSADAFAQLCESALRSGEAPTQHGVRPQVVVVFDAEQFARLRSDPGEVSGRFVASGQPISGCGVRSLISDSRLVRLVMDAAGTPLEAGESVRTVPAGLWRALLVRDGGCVWPGCDAPAAWCDVAHAADAFAEGGRLSPDNSMLLCRRHHRRFDAGSRRVAISGATVTFPAADVRGPTAAPLPHRAPAPVTVPYRPASPPPASPPPVSLASPTSLATPASLPSPVAPARRQPLQPGASQVADVLPSQGDQGSTQPYRRTVRPAVVSDGRWRSIAGGPARGPPRTGIPRGTA